MRKNRARQTMDEEDCCSKIHFQTVGVSTRASLFDRCQLLQDKAGKKRVRQTTDEEDCCSSNSTLELPTCGALGFAI